VPGRVAILGSAFGRPPARFVPVLAFLLANFRVLPTQFHSPFDQLARIRAGIRRRHWCLGIDCEIA